MIINTESHPNTMKAVHLIQQESGDHLAIPVLDVPDRWRDLLPEVEETLGKLSRSVRAPEEDPLPSHIRPHELLDSEFYSFCNGSFEVQQAISNRSMSMMRANVFLADYFEDWSHTSDTGAEVISNVVTSKRIEFLEMLRHTQIEGLTTQQTNELEKLKLELV